MSLRCVISLCIGATSCASCASSSGKLNGIYYESTGSGPAVVLIHGGQMDSRIWDDQVAPLAREGRVIRLDLRGFGRSDAPTFPYSNVDDLRELLDALGVRRASLVGSSLGAAVATELAISHPERVDALVLLGPGLGGFEFKDPANNLRHVVEAARDQGFDAAAELWLKNAYMLPAMEQPALREKLTRLSRDNGKCWLINPLLQKRFSPPAAERLGAIQAPTLVIVGDRDVSDILKIADKLTSEIRGARKVVMPGVGHMPNLEKPEEVLNLTMEFLREHCGR